MEKSQRNPGKKIRIVASEVLPSGEIIELVYKPEYNTTQLAVFKDEQIEYLSRLERPHEILEPYSPTFHLIKKGVILFPSYAEEYGSDARLIGEIRSFIHRYLDVSLFFEEIASYYVLFTWGYDRFNELPYLRALGDYGSGKSRFLQVIGSLCYKPMFVGGATTTSPIFRIIDGFGGTLILDEADYRFSDTTADIIKIMNSGYQKGSPVLRSEGKGTFEIKSYEVFGPKIIATRRRFDDQALESRFLIEEMDKKEIRDDIPINLPETFAEEARALRNKLLMWRFKNLDHIGLRTSEVDRSLEPRLNQIIMPLLSIVGSEMAARLREFVRSYNQELIADRGLSLEATIFHALLECVGDGGDEPTVKQITEKCILKEPDGKFVSRRVGEILRKRLKLILRSTNRGHVVSSLENQKKIEILKRKFGIHDTPLPTVNVVNEVNIQEDKKGN